MDNLKDFQEKFNNKLKQSTDLQKIQFGLDICKRLLPDYKDFELSDKWGDSYILIKAIEFIGSIEKDIQIDFDYLDSLITMVDKVIPDTEDFSGWKVSHALNASASVLELLSYLKDKDYNHIITISTLMTDNIDFNIQMNNDSFTEVEIDNHPILIDEFKYQLKMI